MEVEDLVFIGLEYLIRRIFMLIFGLQMLEFAI